MKQHFLVLMWVCMLISGCSDPLREMVNRKWPPINAELQRQTSIATTARTLAQLTTPSIGINVSLADAKSILLTPSLKQQGVTDIALEGDKQLLSLRVKFSRQFTEADAGDNADLRTILATSRPEIAGSVAIYAGLTSGLVTKGPIPELELRVLPALAQITVDRIKLADKVDATKVAEQLVALLNRYRDNISGELSRSSLTQVKIPALAPKPFDVSKSFQVAQSGGTVQIVVSANPITVPVKLDGVAWLVTNKALTALVQFVPVDMRMAPAAAATAQATAGAQPALAAPPSAASNSTPSASGTAAGASTYEAMRGSFEELVKVAFDVQTDGSTTWVAVRKDFVAAAMNSAISQAGLCASAVAQMTPQKVDTTIPMPRPDGISCAQDRPCDIAACPFQMTEDTRGCGRFDFGCEFFKGAENDRRRIAANAEVVRCQASEVAKKASCELEKSTARGLCEAGKVALRAIGPNVANVITDLNVRTNGAQACLKDFVLAPALDKVQFTLDIQGKAQADVNVKFTPLDVAGHLFCFRPWSRNQSFEASLRESQVGVSSSLQLVTDKGAARVAFVTAPVPIKARLTPSPIEVLLKSPDMMLSCPIANAAPLTFTIAPLIKELRGDIDYTLPSQKVSLDLALPSQKVGEVLVKTQAVATGPALVLTGTVEAPK